MSPWKPGGLQKLMKAFVTLRMLQRESYERYLHFDKDSPLSSSPLSSTEDGFTVEEKEREERDDLEQELMKLLKTERDEPTKEETEDTKRKKESDTLEEDGRGKERGEEEEERRKIFEQWDMAGVKGREKKKRTTRT